MRYRSFFLAVVFLSLTGSGVVVHHAQAKKKEAKNVLLALAPRDNSKLVKKTVKVGNFNAVDVKGGFSVNLKPGPGPKVILESNQNSINQIKVKVIKNALSIRTPNNFTASHAVVHVVAPNLESIIAAGSVSAKVTQFNGGSLRISSHNNCTVESSGSVKSLSINCDGKSFLNLDRLRSKDCVATINDKSFAKVYASNTIKATAMGQSVLSVKGNPKILKKNVAKTSFFKLEK